ncbi:winged helix DNA-binding domain-containing protein [Spirosoma gilvum]
MDLSTIAHHRLHNQQIAQPTFTTINEVVNWMGAMQAQDANLIKWAIGVRLPGTTEKEVSAALDSGKLIRTHLLRPTWHVVAAEDIHWLLDLTAPHVKASIRSRLKDLEITSEVLTTCYTILEKVLLDNSYLTRSELMLELQRANIATDNNRSAHLMMQAELDGIVCNGVAKGKQLTYALLQERVPKPQPLQREEGLAKLAHTYFTSHGPATLADFVWWSGLPITDARRALMSIQSSFASETIGSQTYWFDPSRHVSASRHESLYLLPSFDEYTVSYKDRSAVLTADAHKQAISANGIFSPIIVYNGSVIGLWKRTIKKDKVVLEPSFFETTTPLILSLLEKASAGFGQFLNYTAELTY